LLAWDFGIIDCQMHTGHLASMGAREIPRPEFAQRLIQLVDYAPVPGTWTIEIDTSV
jgi:leucyl/phenylalanyl-tRNA--protein transferase